MAVLLPMVATAVLAVQTMFATGASAGLSYTGKFLAEDKFALHGPLAVTTDADGNAYVADTSAHRIVKFDQDGNPTLIFGTGGSDTAGQPGHLYYPDQLVWSKATNQIYVADSAAHDIQVFTTSGQFVRKWGSQGQEDGQLSLPNAIAVDCAGNVYVGNGQGPWDIEEFSSTGTFIKRFGTGHSGVPGGLVVTNYSTTDCTTPSDIIEADEYDGVLVRYDSTGQYLNTIGTAGHGQFQFDHPDQMALQINGSGVHIWVAESGNFRVQEISTHNSGSTWAYQRQITKGASNLSSTHGVAVDSKGRILVANTGTSEVYQYKDLPPQLVLGHMHNSRGHVRDTHALFFQVTYNQLAQTCKVDVQAKVTVPPHADHVFTVSDTQPVRDGIVDFKLDLSDKQLGFLNKAWKNGRDVDIAAKASGCSNNDIQVSKSTDLSL